MAQTWKPAIGYEGWYEVSDSGNVRSVERTFTTKDGKTRTYKQVVLKICTQPGSRGYTYVNLHKNGLRKKESIHRLVASAFIDNPFNLPEVDHINTIRSDNRVENLRWVTHKENYSNPVTRKNMKTNNWKVKPVIQMDTEGRIVNKYISLSEAARQNNMSRRTLILYCQGKKTPRGSYRWAYGTE